MANILENRFINDWLIECGRSDPLFRRDDEGIVYENWTQTHSPHRLFISEDNYLNLRFISRSRNGQREEIIRLATFVGERKNLRGGTGAILLNGDGLDRGIPQAVQARLRNRVNRLFSPYQRMIVPFMALNGARIDYSSIIPIHITSDRQVTIRTPVKVPFVLLKEENEWWKLFKDIVGRDRGWREAVWNGQRYQSRITHLGWGTNRRRTLQYRIFFQPEHGVQAWWTVGGNLGTNPHISYQVHRLGASVFSAIGPDRERHRYISAFDVAENPALYFLAQLPDEGKVETYDDAIYLLSPPIVHKAREEGRAVFRQGDIFAIETDLTDKIIKDTCRIYRRDKYIILNGRAQLSLRSGMTRKNAANLMIYETGHTATEVARRRSDGAEFVKGTLFHDPFLEEARRTAEHRAVSLGDGSKWFLVCRNTVPHDVVDSA